MFFRIILFLFLSFQYAAAALVITDKEKKYTDFSLSYFNDEHNTLTINKILDTNFTKTIPSQFTQGYLNGTAWFKLTIENRSKNPNFILYFTEPIWSTFDLFEPSSDGWNQYHSGLLTPLDKRNIEDLNPAFSLHINPGESKTYYIKGHSVNSQIGAFELFTTKEYFRPNRLTINTFYLFYTGVLLIIIILNIVLLAEMRERIYAYYIGYVVSFLIFISQFSGSYLSLGLRGWPEGLHTVGTAVLIFMTFFSSEFFQLKEYLPKIHQLFKLFTVIFILLGILISQNIPYASHVFNIVSAIFITILFILAIKTWLDGHIKTPYYLIALIIYMPTMGMMVLTFNALIDNTDFTRYSFLFGALIEIIFFSLILASRFHSKRYDEIRLQKKLLEEKQKNEAYLESEIRKQRKELKEKNIVLFQQARHVAMGEMIGNIAHQWHQPLNTLGLLIQDVEESYEYGEMDAAYIKSMTEKSMQQINFMSKTINDFRNFFQSDDEKSNFSLLDTINDIYSLMQESLSKHDITVDIQIDPALKLWGYKNEFSQVILNLLTNSRDALIERGIQAKKITIYAKADGLNNLLTIKDNAGGIDEAILFKIFDPYFSTKEEGKGSGIGLYMSKMIIEEHHHGKISVSNDEHGALFTILIPFIQ